MHRFFSFTPRPVLAADHVRGSENPRDQGGRGSGRLAENIVHFARALRAAGIPVGPGAVMDALAAVEAAGVGARGDFYWTLHAVLVKRHEHSLIFEQAFRIFFRRRGMLDKLLAAMLPQAPPREDEKPPPGAQRIQEALFSSLAEAERKPPEVEVDARLTVSDREVLQKKDFAQMTAAEIAAAKDAIKRLVLSLDEVKTRRLAPHRHGHLVDIRRTLRASLKAGGAVIDLKYLGPRSKSPPLVALLDISGSMSQYTRLFLHFLHAVTDARKRVHSFLFGTRLTNVTRALKSKDPDEALLQCSASVLDWSGGTRIATSLHDFNKRWARRVLAQGAIVLLINDRLARDEDILKAAEDWRKAGRGVALATVVETWGSAPRPVGSNLVIDDQGNFLGSVSGGCVEGAVVTEALDVIESGKPKTLEFGVADETAWKVGLSCGGTIRVYVEKVE